MGLEVDQSEESHSPRAASMPNILEEDDNEDQEIELESPSHIRRPERVLSMSVATLPWRKLTTSKSEAAQLKIPQGPIPENHNKFANTRRKSNDIILFQSLNNFKFPPATRKQNGKDGETPPGVFTAEEDFAFRPDEALHRAPMRVPTNRGNKTDTSGRRNFAHRASIAVQNRIRKSSLWDLYTRAQIRTNQLRRNRLAQKLFEYFVHTLIVCFVYFVLVGIPLWRGTV